MRKVSVICTLLIICSLQVGAQTPEEKYVQAGQLYSSGDYSGAAAVYRKLFEDGYWSGDMLYNAGNAFFKSGDNASAILFYERARLIDPADEDINYNLQIARSRVTDKFETVPELFFVRWFNFLSLLTSTNTWALAALLLFIASLLFAVIFLTKARANGRLFSFWLSLAALVLSVLFIALAINNNYLINKNKNAVVTYSIVTGRSEPGESSSELFVIHSGTTVKVEKELGQYLEVQLPDGNKGWIRGDCLEKI